MSKSGERLIQAAKGARATTRDDTPLPSELVKEWEQEAVNAEGAGALFRGEGLERTPAIAEGMAEAFRRCARQLQESLDAMQKEGGE